MMSCDRPTIARLFFSPAAERTPSSCGNLTWTREFIADGFFYRKPRPARPGGTATRSTWEPTSDRVHSPAGYPRIVKEWDRSSTLDKARIVSKEKLKTSAWPAKVAHDYGRIYEFVRRRVTFFTNEVYIRRGDEWVRIDKPDDARLGTFGDQILLYLRSDWTIGGMTYPAGALVAADFEAYLRGDRKLAGVV